LRAAPGMELPRQTVALESIVEMAMDAPRGVFTERGVRLEAMVQRSSALVSADTAALLQVFVNLLVNAAEATEAGGSATVSVERTADRAVVQISDTGTGFIADPQARPFLTTKARGTGLGLPIARRITEAHGGTLKVESSPNGATVCVTLPVALGT
jgi:signal transduction histidine kinase